MGKGISWQQEEWDQQPRFIIVHTLTVELFETFVLFRNKGNLPQNNGVVQG
jgi:hypothetical protein